MNRRTFLALAPAATVTLIVPSQFTAAQATPISTGTLPLVYADVAAEYEAASTRALTAGRAIAQQIFAGDILAVYERSSPELQGAIDPATIESMLAELWTNRISFAAPELGLFFDGRLEDDTIDGFLLADTVYGFTLARSGTPAASPAAASDHRGVWSGALSLGAESVSMTVTLDADSGTIAFPEMGIPTTPLSGVAFDLDRPRGALLAELGAPLDRETLVYWGQYAWGDRTLGVTVIVREDGTIDLVQIAPEAQLAPDSAAGFASAVDYRLPFDTLWWVFWGGDHPLANYHGIDQRQRHAIDAVIWNDGATYRTDGVANADYWVYGQPVLAPAAGTVVEILDGVEENTPGSSLPDVHPAGNHVIVQTAPEEFLVLAHMQPGSLTVATGDSVVAGQQLGQTGNSGNSSEPHLHIHLQNEADFFSPTAHGLPLTFTDLTVDGNPMSHAELVQGTFVAPR